jgi:cytochrome c biogenesis protein CcmG/thiol:disulfide interchange protein DsbE
MQKAVGNQSTGSSPETPVPRKRGLRWVIVPVLIFAGLIGLFAFALTSGDPSRLPSALIGKPVPTATYPALAGLTEGGQAVPGFASGDLATGGVSIVNFWASWCAQCAVEQGMLLELRDKAGVPLYGVNYKDDPPAARRFLGRYGNPFNAVGTDESGRKAIEWGVYGMPETFIVNGKGEIVYKHIGAVTPDSIATKLIPAIEAARKAPAGNS